MTAVAFMAVILTASYSVLNLSVIIVDRAQKLTMAEMLAQDLLELTVSKRNENWNSVNPGQFHFEDDLVQGMIFVSGSEVVNGFTRYVTISEVQRDAGGNIVQSGGIVDDKTYKATATVTWTYASQNFDLELVQYITDWKRF